MLDVTEASAVRQTIPRYYSSCRSLTCNASSSLPPAIYLQTRKRADHLRYHANLRRLPKTFDIRGVYVAVMKVKDPNDDSKGQVTQTAAFGEAHDNGTPMSMSRGPSSLFFAWEGFCNMKIGTTNKSKVDRETRWSNAEHNAPMTQVCQRRSRVRSITP